MYAEGFGYPTLAEIRAWIGVPVTSMDDAALGWVAAAEQAAQAATCEPLPDTLPDDLHQSFMRRVARHVAARGVPLGLIGLDSEYGASRLVRWDAEVDRLEAPHVSPVIA
jgi:hypothetical protein